MATRSDRGGGARTRETAWRRGSGDWTHAPTAWEGAWGPAAGGHRLRARRTRRIWPAAAPRSLGFAGSGQWNHWIEEEEEIEVGDDIWGPYVSEMDEEI